VNRDRIRLLLESKRRLIEWLELPPVVTKGEEEGGCGVVGLCCSEPVAGRHIYEPSKQMHNRGNGKGGGISAVGLVPEQLGVDRRTLEECYLVQVAYLQDSVRTELEAFIHERYDVTSSHQVSVSTDPVLLARLEVRPPTVVRYFCRAKKAKLAQFITENDLKELGEAKAEDEYVYQTGFQINLKYYASTAMTAFVMSQGRNMLIMKIVGYAEDVISYYNMEEFKANIWIGHQRFPTKGRVWHPGGAHPFMGLDEALVHNGDFANYHSVTEYLGQKGIKPLFLTDTEVSILLFDLLNRVYGYPLEYILEALAPTTERDFFLLAPEKQSIYRAIQSTHLHRSPDGPWFFIISRNDHYHDQLQLIGITDTSMLRPQVFALVDGEIQIGLIASEKQAIDSALESFAKTYPSLPLQADMYWNARGGSHTDGGSFIFTLGKDVPGKGRALSCTNKFGAKVTVPGMDFDIAKDAIMAGALPKAASSALADRMLAGTPEEGLQVWKEAVLRGSTSELMDAMAALSVPAGVAAGVEERLAVLSLALDRRYPTGKIRRSRLLTLLNNAIAQMVRTSPRIESTRVGGLALVDRNNYRSIVAPRPGQWALAIDCDRFPMEGEEGVSHVICRAHELGWKKIILVGAQGQRFFGCGLGPRSNGLQIDVYGSSGDYLASGLDGAEITIHGNGQDQLGQILASGKLVVHGDVGQTFMYGAKGGNIYIRGNAAGRPLINAVGKPRVIINGTCLDYLAESIMAGDPLNGGGFVVLNALSFDAEGRAHDLAEPYPGGNLFSLASGGAIYVRDPMNKVGEDQLNGGRIVKMGEKDWEMLLPYLRENEALFGISIEDDLLMKNGSPVRPEEIYKKVEVVPIAKAAPKPAEAAPTVKDIPVVDAVSVAVVAPQVAEIADDDAN
jgi:glutamate synthase domain-containing protein 1/glutamate synthase domain-containing protein 3